MPSTVVRDFSYDSAKRVLDITFQSGRKYHYYNVPRRISEGMREARSKGEYFNAFIRDHFRWSVDVESLI